MKKYLFVIVVVFGFLVPAMAEQTYTNSSLKKYDRYKNNSHQPTTQHKHYSNRAHSYSRVNSSSSRRGKNDCRHQIRSAKHELREVEKQIRNVEQKIKFHSKIGHCKNCRAELKRLHDRSRSIQENINDLKLIQAGADPTKVAANRNTKIESEKIQKEEQRKREETLTFVDGENDARSGIPQRSYGGAYAVGYKEHKIENLTYSDGGNDARSGIPQKSYGGAYATGYEEQKKKEDAPNIIMGEWDDRGNHYSPTGNGNAWRGDGTFMKKTGGGYIDTTTGQFVPAK